MGGVCAGYEGVDRRRSPRQTRIPAPKSCRPSKAVDSQQSSGIRGSVAPSLQSSLQLPGAPPGRFWAIDVTSPKVQTVEAGKVRLAFGCCPIHGLARLPVGEWQTDGNGRRFKMVPCPKPTCAVRLPAGSRHMAPTRFLKRCGDWWRARADSASRPHQTADAAQRTAA